MIVQKNKRRLAVRANEDVQVAPEASELLFEVEDVAELIAEVTGEEVVVSAEEEVVTFEIAGEEFTVEAEGTEEIVESATRVSRKPVSAGVRRPLSRTIAASAKAGRTVKTFKNNR